MSQHTDDKTGLTYVLRKWSIHAHILEAGGTTTRSCKWLFTIFVAL